MAVTIISLPLLSLESNIRGRQINKQLQPSGLEPGDGKVGVLLGWEKEYETVLCRSEVSFIPSSCVWVLTSFFSKVPGLLM